ncbi:MAG: type II toxin-antitoxin system VapB family antitoxin [Pseudomonadales bacterium]|mgnify:CR=1 FL=1|jgi:antitoxin VapB|nr:type II toxin-antitoxin system VapB family antitoxin [Pseudomonadales bacterium]MDP7143924.1 type II toxin-antitoxin system VapB family antitoxin [Pseudomonadales bacterium]MDP7357343.1 type II toxin-antitoxin system VapB family antitoxin [Pseudomonadales bacterium]MDP7595908.1 type II toxin-antitoxin system VapB family antitoxin [Pseudomonadales bacterium]HJN49305.1 type II toxin-antitoxin system VapB family antitoxin [Pseudomonadales bacterium]|tara:strand:+ start:3457 stop:3708 length:252 start_codon:yes stop_codon:yes gene_type:complete
MSLNIKSSEADRLVEAVAKLTGESKTQAVIESLRQRLEREKQVRDRKVLAADLMAIGQKCAAHARRDATEHGALLYDEKGMPR